MIPPGQRKYKLDLSDPKHPAAHQLIAELEKCSCEDGWLFVAYGFEESKYNVYKFPCHCRIPSGKHWYDLDYEPLYRNLEPDFQATPAELPGYVFIHPSHKRGFEKLLKRVRAVLARQRAEQGEETPF